MHEKPLNSLVREVKTSIPRFRIEHGLRPDIVDQLVVRSHEPAILANCPRDASERFKDQESVAQWLAQGREAYVLTPRKNLGGLIWYGEKDFPLHSDNVNMTRAPRHTFGIRLYESTQGRGFAEPFMDDTLVDYVQTLYLSGMVDRFQGLWLSTSTTNSRAVDLYHRYGYKDVAVVEQSGDNRFIMVLSNSEITQKVLGA